MAVRGLATEYLIGNVAAVGDRVAYGIDTGAPDPLTAKPPVRDLQVVDQHGRVVLASKDLLGRPALAPLNPVAPQDGTISTNVCDHGLPGSGCDVVVAVPAFRNGHSCTVLAAAPVIPVYIRPEVAAVVLGGAVLLAGALTLTCHRLLGKTLEPVNSIRTELDEIEARDLSRRVPVPPARDEIHELAVSVNRTLARLEKALERQRHFTSDASHELRTPLAAMRAQVEDAMIAPDERDVLAVTGSLLPSLDRLQAIMTDLLTLSRLDARAPVLRTPLDFTGLVTEELARRPRGDEIVRGLQPGVCVRGDALQLGRLITNLLDNAERYADTVTLTLHAKPADPPEEIRFPYGVAILEVLDDGPGIPPDKRELVFERFARLDWARSRDAGGTGLGLPIARMIAEAHGGTLTVEDSSAGARFVLRLPRCPCE